MSTLSHDSMNEVHAMRGTVTVRPSIHIHNTLKR